MVVGGGEPSFPTVDKCDPSRLGPNSTVVSDLDGTLLRSRDPFPYYALVAFETGGVARLLLLLLLTPLALTLRHVARREAASTRVLVFAATAGARVSAVESAARAVLPRFYASDVRVDAWRVFAAGGARSRGTNRRVVVTASPRVMVEPFAREQLGADAVVGTELATWRGRATGLVDARRGVLVGERKAEAVREIVGDVGLGCRRSDYAFMSLCKEAYLVPPCPPVDPVPPHKLQKRVIFHDGRLVQRPTPLVALLTVLWFPVGLALSLLRVAAGALVPMTWLSFAFRLLGVRVIVRGTPPPAPTTTTGKDKGKGKGSLFVCCHRTLLEPVFISAALGRPVSAVTYSLSRLSELLSPIPTVRLTRDRAADAATIRRVLAAGNLAICPEGTTCREPFLLRFSALFAELTDDVVPVAMECAMGVFHGTTARGWKGLDPFYFFMNPCPVYTVTFLDKLPVEMTCGGGGKSSHEVANYVQKMIASTLGYECTGLTRKDKYRALAGNDGVVDNSSCRVAILLGEFLSGRRRRWLPHAGAAYLVAHAALGLAIKIVTVHAAVASFSGERHHSLPSLLRKAFGNFRGPVATVAFRGAVLLMGIVSWWPASRRWRSLGGAVGRAWRLVMRVKKMAQGALYATVAWALDKAVWKVYAAIAPSLPQNATIAVISLVVFVLHSLLGALHVFCVSAITAYFFEGRTVVDKDDHVE
ncbi:hypothetical protein PR202_gb18688 [Eleusine coracana subsp. coracana]|uniref:Phospholipid/glycerol acyltransferase domain-containing protein n=1 Tax=Eleusine coracana subsp. coracana TaxID=191504 RepID=A0AAV5F7N0_ELECO|nr:hypothetical protein PR202_gb18688 [Eleusine coracana subsp. coracana]